MLIRNLGKAPIGVPCVMESGRVQVLALAPGKEFTDVEFNADTKFMKTLVKQRPIEIEGEQKRFHVSDKGKVRTAVDEPQSGRGRPLRQQPGGPNPSESQASDQ